MGPAITVVVDVVMVKFNKITDQVTIYIQIVQWFFILSWITHP